MKRATVTVEKNWVRTKTIIKATKSTRAFPTIITPMMTMVDAARTSNATTRSKGVGPNVNLTKDRSAAATTNANANSKMMLTALIVPTPNRCLG